MDDTFSAAPLTVVAPNVTPAPVAFNPPVAVPASVSALVSRSVTAAPLKFTAPASTFAPVSAIPDSARNDDAPPAIALVFADWLIDPALALIVIPLAADRFVAVMLPVALWSALALRLGELTPDVAPFWPAFVVSALICLPVFAQIGLYRQVVRYMGNHAMVAVVKGVTITAIAISAVAYMVPLKGFPRSVPIIFWLIAFAYVGGSRFAVRSYFSWIAQQFRAKAPVVIYGAGKSGVELSRTLVQQGDHVPVAFVDDDPLLQRRTIDGVYVYAPSALAELLRDTQAREVFVAVPSTAAAFGTFVVRCGPTFTIRPPSINTVIPLRGGLPVMSMTVTFVMASCGLGPARSGGANRTSPQTGTSAFRKLVALVPRFMPRLPRGSADRLPA